MCAQLSKLVLRFAALCVLACCSSILQAQTPSTAAGDCCTAAALAKLAGSLGFVDVIGVKLGMTPAQATAAIHAAEPNLKLAVLNSQLEMPSGSNSKVPRFIATTAPPASDGSEESIIMEFTTPPNAPFLARIYRTVQFPNGKPVAAGNLIQALQKKYGTELVVNQNYHEWVFQTDGQPVTRPLSGTAAACMIPTNGSGIVNVPPYNATLTQNYGEINLMYMGPGYETGDLAPACTPYVAVLATVNGLPPGDPTALAQSMSVVMESAGLLDYSHRATLSWLQADQAAKDQKAKAAAAAQGAPQL
jgi:hypothetical protein